MIHRIEKLKALYRLYDGFIAGIETACKKGCATCCTPNATLTSVEALLIIQRIEDEESTGFLDSLSEKMPVTRFQPAITTNGIAAFCMKGLDPPEEEIPDTEDKCPLIDKTICSIYPVRPFGCRCMVSRRVCRKSGHAEIDPFVLTVNNLFLQVIEHLDTHGFSGNLSDMLMFLRSADNRSGWEKGYVRIRDKSLVANRSIPALLIPPEHRVRIKPLYDAMKTIVETHRR